MTKTPPVYIPLIVEDILRTKQRLDDDTAYTIHDLLCDMNLRDALITIAQTTLKITQTYEKISPAMQILENECRRITRNYKHTAHTIVKQKSYLRQILSDFETLFRLFKLCCKFLESKDKTAFKICEVLASQSSAQIMIASEFIRLLEDNKKSFSAKLLGKTKNNIIPFKISAKQEQISNL